MKQGAEPLRLAGGLADGDVEEQGQGARPVLRCVKT